MDIVGLLNQAEKPRGRAETKKGEEADDGFEKLFQTLAEVNHAEQRASTAVSDATRAGSQAAGTKAGVNLGKGGTAGTDLTALQQVPAAGDTTADAAPADGAAAGLVSRPVDTGPARVDTDAPAAAAANLVARGVQELQNTGSAGRLPPTIGRGAPPAGEAPAQFLRQSADPTPTGQSNTPQTGLGAKVVQTPAQLMSRPGAAPGTAQATLAGQAPTAPASLLGTLPATPVGVGADTAAAAAPPPAAPPPGSAPVASGPPVAGNPLAAVNAGLTGDASQQQAGRQAAAQAAARVAQATAPQSTAPQPTAPLPVDAGAATAAGPSQQAGQARATAHTPQAARHAPAAPPVAEQVAVQIQRAVKAGIDRINIQLKPAHLGRIDISLDVALDGRVQAVVQADNPDTLQMLMRDHRELERALQQANLQLDQNSLSFELRGENKRYAADGSLLASGDGDGDDGGNDGDAIDAGAVADTGDGINLVI